MFLKKGKNMKKVLLIATVQSHIAQFHKPLVKMLHSYGYEVHVAARNNLAEKNGLKLDFVEKVIDIPFSRNPFNIRNIKAKKQLKKILKSEFYDFIHCNTPVGGILGRMCGKRYRKKGTQIIYTAHGFHFYKGCPKKNWILFYPIEKYFARVTDKLITITDEDNILSTNRFKTHTFHIHGIGVNRDRFHIISNEERTIIRNELGLPINAVLLLQVGELNQNKNQITTIKAVEKLVNENEKLNIILLIAGNGPKDKELHNYVKFHNLNNYVKFIGYDPHIERYTKIVDVIISSSIREGLGINVIEGMLCGHIVFASYNRGHDELLGTDDNYQFIANDFNKLSKLIYRYLINPDSVKEKIEYNLNKALLYTTDYVEKELESIYFNK